MFTHFTSSHNPPWEKMLQTLRFSLLLSTVVYQPSLPHLLIHSNIIILMQCVFPALIELRHLLRQTIFTSGNIPQSASYSGNGWWEIKLNSSMPSLISDTQRVGLCVCVGVLVIPSCVLIYFVQLLSEQLDKGLRKDFLACSFSFFCSQERQWRDGRWSRDRHDIKERLKPKHHIPQSKCPSMFWVSDCEPSWRRDLESRHRLKSAECLRHL